MTDNHDWAHGDFCQDEGLTCRRCGITEAEAEAHLYGHECGHAERDNQDPPGPEKVPAVRRGVAGPGVSERDERDGFTIPAGDIGGHAAYFRDVRKMQG